MSHNVGLLSLIILWREYGNILFLCKTSLLVVPLSFICFENFLAMFACMLQATPGTPPLLLGCRERLRVAWGAYPDVRLTPQVAEAGVDLLVGAELAALEGLAVAVASVTDATCESFTMVRELLAQRSLCYWRS